MNKNIFILIILVFTFSSCDLIKKNTIQESYSSSPVNTKELIEKVNSENISPEWISLNAKIDIVLITSAESLHNLCALFGEEKAPLLRQFPLLVISDRIAMIAAEHGFGRAAGGSISVAEGASDEAIIQALIHYVDRSK